MASALATVTGEIGGSPVNLFTGTPGLPGAQAQNDSGGFLNSLGSSPIGSFIGGGIQDLGTSIIGGLSPDGSSLSNAAKSAGSSTNWTELFLRGVVIILGFIFVAIGLTMFHQNAPTIIEGAGNHFRALGKKAVLKK